MAADADDVRVCPLCCEDMDIEDKYFFPCPCGYQLCRFCWNKIYEETNRLCPACRREYDKNSVIFTPVSADEMVRYKKRKQQKLKKRDTSADMASPTQPRTARANPPSKDVKVLQKNLVYVSGIPAARAVDEVLRSNDYFGQFGKVSKLVIHRKPAPSTHLHGEPQVSAYVTYANPQSAQQAILFLDGAIMLGESRPLRASFGTTKYCASFLANRQCMNRECLYLHEYGEEIEDLLVVNGPRTLQGSLVRVFGPSNKSIVRPITPVASTTNSTISSISKDNDTSPALPATVSWASQKQSSITSTSNKSKPLTQTNELSSMSASSDNEFPTIEAMVTSTCSGNGTENITQSLNRPKKKKQKLKESSSVAFDEMDSESELKSTIKSSDMSDEDNTTYHQSTPFDSQSQCVNLLQEQMPYERNKISPPLPTVDIAAMVIGSFPADFSTSKVSPASSTSRSVPVSPRRTSSPGLRSDPPPGYAPPGFTYPVISPPGNVSSQSGISALPLPPPPSVLSLSNSRLVLQAMQQQPPVHEQSKPYQGGFNPFDAGDVVADILSDKVAGVRHGRMDAESDGSFPLSMSVRDRPQFTQPVDLNSYDYGLHPYHRNHMHDQRQQGANSGDNSSFRPYNNFIQPRDLTLNHNSNVPRMHTIDGFHDQQQPTSATNYGLLPSGRHAVSSSFLQTKSSGYPLQHLQQQQQQFSNSLNMQQPGFDQFTFSPAPFKGNNNNNDLQHGDHSRFRFAQDLRNSGATSSTDPFNTLRRDVTEYSRRDSNDLQYMGARYFGGNTGGPSEDLRSIFPNATVSYASNANRLVSTLPDSTLAPSVRQRDNFNTLGRMIPPPGFAAQPEPSMFNVKFSPFDLPGSQRPGHQQLKVGGASRSLLETDEFLKQFFLAQGGSNVGSKSNPVTPTSAAWSGTPFQDPAIMSVRLGPAGASMPSNVGAANAVSPPKTQSTASSHQRTVTELIPSLSTIISPSLSPKSAESRTKDTSIPSSSAPSINTSAPAAREDSQPHQPVTKAVVVKLPKEKAKSIVKPATGTTKQSPHENVQATAAKPLSVASTANITTVPASIKVIHSKKSTLPVDTGSSSILTSISTPSIPSKAVNDNQRNETEALQKQPPQLSKTTPVKPSRGTGDVKTSTEITKARSVSPQRAVTGAARGPERTPATQQAKDTPNKKEMVTATVLPTVAATITLPSAAATALSSTANTLINNGNGNSNNSSINNNNTNSTNAINSKKKKKKKGKQDEQNESLSFSVLPTTSTLVVAAPAPSPIPSKVTINGFDFAIDVFVSPEPAPTSSVSLSKAAAYLEKLGFGLDNLWHDVNKLSVASLAKEDVSSTMNIDVSSLSLDFKSFFDVPTGIFGTTSITPPPPLPPQIKEEPPILATPLVSSTNNINSTPALAAASFTGLINEAEMQALELQYQNAKKEAAMWEQKLKQIMKKNKYRAS